MSRGTSGRYFAFDNGAAYFPVGENLGWAREENGGIYAYKRWLDQLHAVGANYARLNIDMPWFIGLEWSSPAGDYTAAQAAAWRLDTILEMAEQRRHLPANRPDLASVLCQLCRSARIPSRRHARPDTRADWNTHPYNVANGGPLDNFLADVFTDEQGPGVIAPAFTLCRRALGLQPACFRVGNRR